MRFMVKTIDTTNGVETKNHFFDDVIFAIDFATQPVNNKGNAAKVFDSDGRLVFDTAKALGHPDVEEVVPEDVAETATTDTEEVVTETPAPKTKRKKTV